MRDLSKIIPTEEEMTEQVIKVIKALRADGYNMWLHRYDEDCVVIRERWKELRDSVSPKALIAAADIIGCELERECKKLAEKTA